MKYNTDISIRRATQSDEINIAHEWRSVYAEEFQFKYPDRWRWQFEENPFLTHASCDGLPIWIVQVNGKIAGWSCAMMVKCHILEKVTTLAYGIDMHIKSFYRRRRLGYWLQKENQDNQPAFMSIQMSEGSRRIKRQIGGVEGNPFKIYLKLNNRLDGGLLYKSLMKNQKYKNAKKCIKLVHKVLLGYEFEYISMVLSYLMKKKQKKSFQKSKYFKSFAPPLNFEKRETFGDEITRFWNKVKCNFGFAVVRNKKYLNWKYVDQPHLDYHKYYAIKNDEIVGLLVFRIGKPPEIKSGVIAEMIAIDNEHAIYDEMLNFANRKMHSMGAIMIRIGTSINGIDAVLETSGFQLIETKIPIIHLDQKKIPVNIEELKKRNWLMSLGDQDMDIPVLNQQPEFGVLIKALNRDSELIPWRLRRG